MALGGCDVAEVDGLVATGTDADVDVRVDADVGADVVEVGGSERVVSLAGLGARGEAREDLFPDLSGDDLVWVQSWLDVSAPGVNAETQCLSCPYCNGCRWDLMYRRLPAGPPEVLSTGASPRSGPLVGDGVIVWLDDAGNVVLRDLVTAEVTRVPALTWLSATPTPHGGRLWWWGYDSLSGSYGLISYDRKNGVLKSGLSVYLQDPNASASSSLSGLSRRQPFTVTDDAVLFALWEETISIQQWSFTGNATPVIKDPQRSHLRVLQRADGALVTLSYDNTDGCQTAACALAFTAFVGEAETPLAPDAVPTRYVPPVVAGDRLLWVDHRDGAYAVYGVGPDGAELRLSSDEAEIGAVSSIAASGRRVVWADHRSGRWRLMARDW